MNLDLAKYVDGAKKSGQTNEKISADLKANGWNDQDIAEVLNPSYISPKSHKSLLFIIAVVIFLFLIGGGGYFVYKNQKIQGMSDVPKEETSVAVGTDTLAISGTEKLNIPQYVHPTGVYSLSYPAEWEQTFTSDTPPKALDFFVESKNLEEVSGINISLINKEDLEKIKNPTAESPLIFVKNISLGGLTGQEFKSDSSRSTQLTFLVPLSSDSSVNLVINVAYPLALSSTPNQILHAEALINSLKFIIDSSKIPAVLNAFKGKNNDLLQGQIQSMVIPATTFYNSHNSSYLGFCNSMTSDINSGYSRLKQKISNTKCSDSKDAYAVSAEFPNGDFYCRDSSGFANPVASLHADYKCPVATSSGPRSCLLSEPGCSLGN